MYVLYPFNHSSIYRVFLKYNTKTSEVSHVKTLLPFYTFPTITFIYENVQPIGLKLEIPFYLSKTKIMSKSRE